MAFRSAEDWARAYGVTDYTKRIISSVEPPHGYARDSDFYQHIGSVESGTFRRVVNVGFLRSHFYKEGKLTDAQILFILGEVKALFMEDPNVVRINGKLTIVGDIHGQYFDLVHILSPQLGGNPLKTPYLFLGDYVDRGCFSVECALWLFALKIYTPETLHMLRGNHESRTQTEYFTFKLECIRKYSLQIYEAFLEVFNTLPLAAVVDGKFFCAHGGISPDLHTIDDLDVINRFQEPPRKGLMCDILWSDPAEPGNVLPGQSFIHNLTRGCSYYYTHQDVVNFLQRNGLQSIIRGHEAQEEGYCLHQKTKPGGLPSIMTVFSAPNYCDWYGNKGAILCYDGEKLNFKQYFNHPHPFWLGNFMDAFSWSLPFVGMKVLELLEAILETFHPDEFDSDYTDNATPDMRPGEVAQRREGLIMRQIYSILRQDAEAGSEMRGVAPELSPNTLTSAQNPPYDPFVDQRRASFERARESDVLNERIPPRTLDIREAREWFNRRGGNNWDASTSALAHRTSVGTTASTSPSMRRREIQVTMGLIKAAKKLLEANRDIPPTGEEGKGGRVVQTDKGMLGLLRALEELQSIKKSEHNPGSQLAVLIQKVEEED